MDLDDFFSKLKAEAAHAFGCESTLVPPFPCDCEASTAWPVLIAVAEAADFDVGIWHSQTRGHDRATCTTIICKRLRDLEALAGGL